MCFIININTNIDININLREVGALPEYSSREGCGVEVPDSCDEGSRQFGRLVIHSFHIGIALWTLSFWVPACELYIGISFLGFRRVSGSESLRVPESQSSRVSESQSFKISESQSLRVPESHNLRVSQSQSLRVSEFQSLRVPESQSLRGKERKSKNSRNR